MAAAINNKNIPNEEWLVFRARDCLKSDPFAAKSWLITARTLYPHNFSIQFEAYGIEKEESNLKEAAKLLQEMFINFPQEPLLWTEIRYITDALAADIIDSKMQFLIDMISIIPSDLQCSMLFKVSESTHDILEQCRLKLLALSRFPHLIENHGTELINTLISKEKHSHPVSSLNCYRKYLVCDVIPMVLKSEHLNVPAKLLYKWLRKAIDFYVCYIMLSAVPDNTNCEMLSPTKSFSGGRKTLIHGLTEKESFIQNPWANIYDVLRIFGKHLKWKNSEKFVKPSVESRWQMLYQLHCESESGACNQQVLFNTSVLLLECLYNYAMKVDPDQFSGGNNTPPLALVEGIKLNTNDSSEPRPKKLRVELQNVPKIHISKQVSSGNIAIQHFMTAAKCWELLHSSEAYKKEFYSTFQQSQFDSWQWLNSFKIDLAIFRGNLNEAINLLKQTSHIPKSGAYIRQQIQLICCNFALGKLSYACDVILDMIQSFPVASDTIQNLNPTLSGQGRQLMFITCNQSEIVPYCIELLISALKEKAFKANTPDNLLGHMIVLLQYDWPRHESLFLQAIEVIKARVSFTYSPFFNYIVNIDILEEFSYLKTKEGGKVNLEIMQVTSQAISQQRTVTRGVQKNVREDFQATLQKQISRSEESPEIIVRNFLSSECESLKSILMLE